MCISIYKAYHGYFHATFHCIVFQCMVHFNERISYVFVFVFTVDLMMLVMLNGKSYNFSFFLSFVYIL